MASLLSGTRYGAPVESHFVTKYAARVGPDGELPDGEQLLALVRAILAERPVAQWRVSRDAESLIGALPSGATYADLVDALFAARAGASSSGWGDKTPHYLGRYDTLASLFPDARFVYLVRDGRDVALSLLGRKWGPNNVYAAARYWRDLNTLPETMRARLDNGEIPLFRYETLLEEPRREIARLYEFLNEPMDERKLASLAATARADNGGRWRERMSRRQLRDFGAAANITLEALGYETIPSLPLETPRIAWLRCHDAVLGYARLIHLNTVEAVRIRYFGKAPFAE